MSGVLDIFKTAVWYFAYQDSLKNLEEEKEENNEKEEEKIT